MEGKPIRVEGIAIEVQIVFRPEHIELLRAQFEKVKLPPTTIDTIIDAYIASGEKVPYERFFLEYAQKTLNPIINKQLNRAVDHPTINKMLLFVLKEVIENDPTLIQFRKFKIN